MALGVGVLPFLATSLLFLHPLAATKEALSPMPSHTRNETCGDVDCGMGSCKAGPNGSFPFSCKCEPGWKQFYVADSYFVFTPCVIPDCIQNSSCIHGTDPAPAAAPSLAPHNHSFFDPCTWGYCGEGTCMKISTFRHRCICREGYANLLNVSAFPCFSECAFVEDCLKQGVGSTNVSGLTNSSGLTNGSGMTNSSGLTNSSSSARPTLSDGGRAANNACSGFSRNLLQMIILGISLATVPWL